MCAANVSEGRDAEVLDALRAAAGDALLDVHVDVDHHRSVLTMAGAADALVDAVLRPRRPSRSTGSTCAATQGSTPGSARSTSCPSPRSHEGALDAAVAAREAAMRALAGLGIPSFRYGPAPDGTTRSLPEVRRGAFAGSPPTPGRRPRTRRRAPPPSGRGARSSRGTSGSRAPRSRRPRRIAAAVRGAPVRALGFEVTGATQVSCNLLDPARRHAARRLPPGRGRRCAEGAHVVRCELVGLVPDGVLRAVPEVVVGAPRPRARTAPSRRGRARWGSRLG